MPLPSVGDSLSFPNSNKLPSAHINSPPVTNDNAVHAAQRGNAIWVGKKLTISDQGLQNYWYVPQAPDKVSYCVVPCHGRGDAYVISDQFGGCEWHVLHHASFRLLAFLHISRGFGKLAEYTMAPGWKLIQERRSSNLVNASTHMGEKISGTRILSSAMGVNWAIAHIDRSGGTDGVVNSAFVNVMPQEGFRVRLVNSGAGPYVVPRR